MAYYEFPHSRTYDQDLGWIIQKLEELQKENEALEARVKALEEKDGD